MFFRRKPAEIPSAAEALPGRPDPIPTAETHFVNGRSLKGPFPEGSRQAMFGMGCFWGVERMFWNRLEGVYTTAVGYAARARRPTRRTSEVCSGHDGAQRGGAGGL